KGPLDDVHVLRDVVEPGAQLVVVDAVVIGQLEPVAVPGQAHEDVDRLFADRHPPPLFEAERLVERDGAVDLTDPVTGVNELHSVREGTVLPMIVERSMNDQWLSNTYLVAAGPHSDAF